MKAAASGMLTPRDLALAVLIAFVWGGSFIVIKASVAEAPPLLMTGLRFTLAALPGVLFIPRPQVRLVDLVGYGLCIGVGQFGMLFAAIAWGMPSGLASLIIQLQTLFTMALARIVLGQRVSRGQIAGALVALAGAGVIGFFRGGATPVLPFLMVLAAAAFWSGGNLFAIRAGRTHLLGFIVWSSLVAPLPLFALSWLIEDHAAIAQVFAHPSWIVFGGAACLAYGPTLVGFGLWSYLLSRYPAAQVTPFSLLVPVFGMAGAALVYREALSLGSIVGSAIVMAGLAITVFSRR